MRIPFFRVFYVQLKLLAYLHKTQRARLSYFKTLAFAKPIVKSGMQMYIHVQNVHTYV